MSSQPHPYQFTVYHLQYRMIMAVIREIAMQPSLDRAVSVIIQRATEILVCERVTLFHVDNAAKRLTIATSAGAESSRHVGLETVSLPLDEASIAGSAAVVRAGGCFRALGCVALIVVWGCMACADGQVYRH